LIRLAGDKNIPRAISEESVSESNQPSFLEDSRLESAKRKLGTQQFTTKQYMEVLKISKATACRNLSELVAAKALKKIGNGKLITYTFL
jgi:Fic family protein